MLLNEIISTGKNWTYANLGSHADPEEAIKDRKLLVASRNCGTQERVFKSNIKGVDGDQDSK